METVLAPEPGGSRPAIVFWFVIVFRLRASRVIMAPHAPCLH